MKKILVSSLLFLSFAVPLVSLAADNTTTIEWSIPTASIADIQNYVLRYSPNSDMQGSEPQSCEPWQETGTQTDQTFFTMTCNRVPVVLGQPAYFTLEVVIAEGATFVSSIFTKYTGLSPVLNFQALTP